MKVLVILALVLAVAFMWYDRLKLTAELERTREELREARVSVESTEKTQSANAPEWFNERLHKDSGL